MSANPAVVSGEIAAAKIVAGILGQVVEIGMEINEELCRTALEVNNDVSTVMKLESTKKVQKKIERKSSDMFSKLNSLSANQIKNQQTRFGWDPSQSVISPRQSWGFSLAKTSPTESRDYEEVISPDILNAPICDVCIVQTSDPIPDGFHRIYKSPRNKKANLNSQSGGNPIYLCIKKDLTGTAAPITNFIVFFPDRNEYVPPGYYIVQRGAHACNINTGTSAERVYLCYKKDLAGNPITDIQVIFPTKGEETPKSFNRIDKSFSGVHANLNVGTGGLECLLTYKQSLTRLGVLNNESNSSLIDHARAHRRSTLKIGSVGGSASSVEDILRARNKSIVDRHAAAVAAAASGSASAEKASSSGASNGHFFSDKLDRDDPHDGVRHARSSSDVPPSLQAVNNVTPGREGRALTTASGQSNHSGDDNSLADPGSPINVKKELSSAFLAEDEGGNGNEFDEGFIDQEDAYAAVTEDEGTNSARKHKEVVDVTGRLAPLKSRKSLLAILSAVYVRHGTVADEAVDGLCRLLKDTDFFHNDLTGLPLPGTITMIDLTVETICDRFDISSEGEHDKLLQFIKILIKHSGARLSPPSLQRMFRAISFLCNIHSTKSNWILAGLPMPCNEPGEMLTPYKALKHLISDTVAQVELIDFSNYLPETDVTYTYDDEDDAQHSDDYLDVRFIVEDLVENIIDSVEVSRLSEAAYLTVSKQSITTTSGVFWQNVNNLSRRLFIDYQNRSAFVTLCAICKQAWMGIRTNSNGHPIPRDLGIKLIALEAITEFCLCAGEKMSNSKIMGYQIRRIVVPCILYNVNYALVDHKIFSKLMKIVTALWKRWRHCVRIEFAILCEQLIFKVLQASVVQIRPIFQMIVIQEVINWFDQPHLLVEMFVNYDMDRKFVSHWNTFSYLVRTVCAIARRLTVVTGAWDWKPGGVNYTPEESNKISITIRDVHLQALDQVVRMAKTLMDASGHAYLIIQDEAFRNRSLGATGGWIEDDETGVGSGGGSSHAGSKSPDSPNSSPVNTNGGGGRKRVGSVRMKHAAHQEAEDMIKEAIKIYKEKDSLKKAVDYLIKQNFMANTPQEIANFLRVYKNSFDPSAIGDFLGEGGVTPREIDYWSQIRFRYTRAVSFVEMDIEPALRLYLTGCGFRLPGEAQKIDRFVEVFVKAFWQDNGGTPNCPFKHQDTVHLVSYATIMLNTDLHRANTGGKNKNKKMTKEEFLRNLRGADQGSDIDQDYLSRIYDNIESHPIELEVPTAGSAAASAKREAEATKVMGGDLAANALANASKAVTSEVRIAEEKKFIREVCRSLRDSEDLLRSLSPFSFRFQSGLLSMDLVSCMFETVWFHFQVTAEALLNAPIQDTYVKFAALDILCYSLTSAIFLDLKVERMTFAGLLKNFRETCEKGPRLISSSSSHDKKVPDNSWYDEVENANPFTSMETIAKVHHLMVHIKDTIQETSTYEQTRQIASRFEKKAKILENNIFFVRQGELIKLNRQSKPVTYTFFLFSDFLIYAHLAKNVYKIHEQLSLNAMSIADNDTDTTYTSFYISHPIKSFYVVAESPVAKQQWMRDIQQTINSCIKREKTKQDQLPVNRRMSIYERIDSQQIAHTPHRPDPVFGSPERSVKSAAMRKIPSENLPPPPPPAVASVAVNLEEASFQAIPFSNVAAASDTTSEHEVDSIADEVATAQPPALPTPEERAEAHERAKVAFNEMVRELSETPLNSLFTAGITFWKGMTKGKNNSDATQNRLYGLYRQGKTESAAESRTEYEAAFSASGATAPALLACASSDGASKEPPTSAQLLAWNECLAMKPDEAKREFLNQLFSSAPYWKFEQFM